MAQGDKYIQFSLCLLTLVRELSGDLSHYKSALELILAYSMNHAGKSYLDEIRYGFEIEDVPDEQAHKQGANDYDEENEAHISLAWGADTTNIRIGTFENTEKNLERAKKVVKACDDRHGRSPFIRLKTSLLFEARDNRMKPRDIICYMAVLAIIGDAKFKQVSYDRILWAAHGCKSAAMFKSEISTPWLTKKQIRTGVDVMRKKGFLAVALINNRHRYYSTRRSVEELSRDITEQRTKRVETESKRAVIKINT